MREPRTRDLGRAGATRKPSVLADPASAPRQLWCVPICGELLRSYRGQGRAEAWAAFADAESLPEPIAARRTTPEEDPFGVARAFEVGA